MIYAIPAYNLSLLNEKLEKLNKRAVKLGCEPVTTRFLSYQRIKRQDHGMVTFYEFEINGATPKFEGWTFLATLEHVEGIGNIVRPFPGAVIPDSYRSVPSLCEHCNKKRKRIDTYLVKNESDEIKQVGKNCMKDFLGHTDPARIAWLASLLMELRDLSDEEYQGGSPLKRKVPLVDFVAKAAEVIKREGFVSKSAALKTEGRLSATSGETWYHLFPPPKNSKDRITKPPYPTTQESIELAEKAIEYGLSLAGAQSEYEHNLGMACRLEFVEYRHAGLLSSLVHAYQKNVLKIQQQYERAKASPSKHFGTIDKRETFIFTVQNEYAINSDFIKNACVYRLVDPSGNIASWFTQAGQLRVGRTYQVKATVKAHTDYKGIPQTKINRCSVLMECFTDMENK